MHKPRSLSQQALIAFALAALVPALLLGTVGAVAVRELSALARGSARTALAESFNRRMMLRVTQRAEAGDALFRGVLSQAITLSQYATAHVSGAPLLPQGADGLAFADPLLTSIQQTTPGAYRAWIRTTGSQFRAFPNQATGQAAIAVGTGRLAPEFLNPPAFPTWSAPYPDPDSARLIITAAASAYAPDRKAWGMAGVDLLLSSVSASVLRGDAGPGEYDILLDQSGRIVNISDQIRTDLALPAAAAPQAWQPEDVSLLTSADERLRKLGETLVFAAQPGQATVEGRTGRRYVTYARMAVTGWTIAQVVPESAVSGASADVEAAIRQRETLFLGGGAVGLSVLTVLVVLLAARASRSLARPVATLVTGSGRLARDLSYRLSDPLPAELAPLAHAMNTMADSLEQSRNEAVQSARMVAEERNRLAREIHDTIAQGLTAVVVQLQTVEDLLGDGAPPDALTRLARARAVARESLSEARRSVWNLRPIALAEGGLANAIGSLQPVTEAEGVACTMALARDIQLTEPQEDALFRVCQEALANVRKHSGARHVHVALLRADGCIRLTVIDDGRGFDPDALAGPQPAGGFGIWSMRSRMASVGGSVMIESTPGAGTKLTAAVAGGDGDGAGDQGARG